MKRLMFTIISLAFTVFCCLQALGQTWPDGSYGNDGWIKTNWHQRAPFSNSCPLNEFDNENERCAVGCTSLATAQIINYHKYPQGGVLFDNSEWYSDGGDKYHSWGDMNWDQIFMDYEEFIIGDNNVSIVMDFPSFDDLNNSLNEILYDDSGNSDMYDLSFAVGIKLQANFGFMSDADVFRVPHALLAHFYYGSAENVGGWSAANREAIIENIKKGMPVQIGISDTGAGGIGHSLIIDGYDDATEEFHLNMGWSNENYSRWYPLPVFDAGDNHWDNLHTIILNISPYFGWPQYGGNQENTFNTNYSAPIESEIKVKWQASVNPASQGMIVGSGNNIYITKNPLIINDDNYHPSFVIVNQYGEKEDEIEISQTSRTISHPIQSLDGNIYFGAGDGVYRFDIATKDIDLVYHDDGNNYYGDHIPRLDEDGRMYFGSDTSLKCLSSTGNLQWTWNCPAGGVVHTGLPSIDTERNNVYIGYWVNSNQTAHLVCINRYTGTTKYEIPFSDIPSADRGIYTPAIGSDGTIYVNVRTKIYALTAELTSFSQKWVKDFLYARYQPIALGGDDTLYAEYWTYTGENYYVTFAALDSQTGDVKWHIDKPDVGSSTNFGQPYCSGNGVVIFPVKWDTDPIETFVLFAYRDNGTSATELWNYQTSHDENSKMAMGPGATVYIYGNNQLTALSEGPIGDADGGGMAYLDNIRPNMPESPVPSNGTTDTNTTVDLTWVCTDPENHSIKYSLYVGQSGYDMIPVATNLDTNTYQLIGLKYATSYRWMIIATDGQAIAEGPTWVFTTINDTEANKVATPTISPNGGTFSEPPTISLSCSTPDSTIRYTIDGSTPTSDSTEYPGPFWVASYSYTIQARAFRDGYTESDVATADFSILPEETPELSVSPVLRNVIYSAGTTSFTVNNIGSGSMPWTASVVSGGSWLTITSGSSGTDTGTIYVEYSANDTESNRTGTIRITASGADGSPINVSIIQSGSENIDTDEDGEPDATDTDDDNDGISDEIENAHPNGGDGNGDSILDGLQAHVASFLLNDNQGYVTIESPAGTTLVDCEATESPALYDMPDDVEFPYGFLNFTIIDLTPGDSAILKLYFPENEVIETYYKYGPTIDNPLDHWYEFLYDGQTGAEFNGNEVTLYFVDGARGDSDLDDTNGVVVDPGGAGAFIANTSNNPSGSGGGGGGGCFIQSLLN